MGAFSFFFLPRFRALYDALSAMYIKIRHTPANLRCVRLMGSDHNSKIKQLRYISVERSSFYCCNSLCNAFSLGNICSLTLFVEIGTAKVFLCLSRVFRHVNPVLILRRLSISWGFGLYPASSSNQMLFNTAIENQ